MKICVHLNHYLITQLKCTKNVQFNCMLFQFQFINLINNFLIDIAHVYRTYFVIHKFQL